MLSHETPYPYVGSYALYSDPEQPYPPPTELVRVQWRREGFAMVSFPLRDGAAGNKVVAFAELIDGTALDAGEQREFHDLDRLIRGRQPADLSKTQRAKAKRRDALKNRMI